MARHPPALPPQCETVVTRLGVEGDGLAVHPATGAALYLPFTLPGERVRAEATHRRGEGFAGIAEVLAPAAERVAAPCAHFGACGGCALQHMRDDAYAAWKTGLLAGALARAGYGDAAIAPLRRTPPGGRRRMDLALRRVPGGVAVGLHAARSERVVDLDECPVLAPALAALIPALRGLLRRLSVPRRAGSAVVNLLENGADLLLRLDGAPNLADRTRLAAFAAAQGVARISVQVGSAAVEPVAVPEPPEVRLGGVAVRPPAGGFLQASAEGEAAIVDAVLAGLPEKLAGRAVVADLFAGSGTLTFALAQWAGGRARVAAYEGDGPALAALKDGARRAGLAGRGGGVRARPGAAAAAGGGAGGVRGGGAGPAACRGGGAGGADRGEQGGAGGVCELQPGGAGAGCGGAAGGGVRLGFGGAGGSVPVVGAVGECLRV
jgi:23S rRNA (uracil1939-C5)-methyltransferase